MNPDSKAFIPIIPKINLLVLKLINFKPVFLVFKKNLFIIN